MTSSDLYSVGHRNWWRVQTCPGDAGVRHKWTPQDGPGEWTARYDVQDENAETRRPARCVEHFGIYYSLTFLSIWPDGADSD